MNRHHLDSDEGATVLQCNLRNSILSLQTVIEYARRKNIHLLLLQDVPNTSKLHISDYFGFQKFSGSKDASSAPSAIFVRNGIPAYGLEILATRATGIMVQTHNFSFGLISAYIRHTTG